MQHQGCYHDDAVLHPSFLLECLTPQSFTEARRAGLLSRAPVKSSFIGVPQWHLLAPNSEPGPYFSSLPNTWRRSLVLLVSRSFRQSSELFRMLTDFHRRLGAPMLIR